MGEMFWSATIFNQDIGNWDVGNVTDMGAMFAYSTFNRDIGNWYVSNVTNMNALFAGSDFNQDIGSWEVGNVTNMIGMFSNTTFNQNIGNWDVSNVNYMYDMFYNANDFDQDIGNWDVGNVTDMNRMFSNTAFNQNIGNWDVSNVNDMTRMFLNAFYFNQDISGWCVEQIPYEPYEFSVGSPLLPENKPRWGVECTTGINNLSIDNNLLFPNPTESTLSININSPGKLEIIVYNQLNQIVMDIETSSTVIDISALKKGLYIVEIITKEKRIKQKVIKQ